MEVLDTLGVNPIVALIQIGIFLIFYIILKHYLFTPILKIVNSRENLIRSKNEEIDMLTRKIGELEEKINSIIAESDKNVLKVEEEKLKEVLQKKTQIVTKMQEEFIDNLTKLRESFEIEKKKITEELKKVLEPLHENIMSKLTHTN